MIYFILCTRSGQIKIGKSRHVKTRLHQNQTGSSSRLVVIAIGHGYTEEEGILHTRLKSRRRIGEYFSLRPWHLAWAIRYTDAVPMHPRALNAVKYFGWLTPKI